MTAEEFQYFPNEQQVSIVSNLVSAQPQFCLPLLIVGPMQVEQDLTDDDLVALICDDESSDSDKADDDDSVADEYAEEVITCPSLKETKQLLKRLAVFVADNCQFSAQEEMQVQRLATKVAKMTVSRIDQRQQASIRSFFAPV